MQHVTIEECVKGFMDVYICKNSILKNFPFSMQNENGVFPVCATAVNQ